MNLQELAEAITKDMSVLRDITPTGILARLVDPNGPLARQLEASGQLLDKSEQLFGRIVDKFHTPNQALTVSSLAPEADALYGAIQAMRIADGRPAPNERGS